MTNSEVLKELNNGHLIEMPQIPVVLKKKKPSEKAVFINCVTSQRGDMAADIIDISKPFKLIKAERKIKGYAFAYDEKLDLLAVFIGTFSTAKLKRSETRKWQEITRFYINRDKNLFIGNKKNGSYTFTFYESLKDYGKPLGIEHMKNRNGICRQLDAASEAKIEDFSPVWKVFPPIATMKSEKTYMLGSIDKFSSFLSHRDPVWKDTVRQKKIDSFASCSLKSIDFYHQHAMNEARRYYFNGKNYPVIFYAMERLDCDRSVVCIRKFACDFLSKAVIEVGRVYFDGKTALSCKADNKGNFIHVPIYDNSNYWTDHLIGYEHAKTRGTVLEYISEIVEGVPEYKRIFCILALTKMPVLERLYKAGYKEATKLILEWLHRRHIELKMKCTFGKLNKRSKSLCGIFGLSKYQMDVLFGMIVKYGCSTTNLVLGIKCILSSKRYRAGHSLFSPLSPLAVSDHISISNIDRESFNRLTGAIERISEKYREIHGISDFSAWIQNKEESHSGYVTKIQAFFDIMSLISKNWGVATAIKIVNRIEEMIMNIIICEYHNYSVFYRDYLDMVDVAGLGNLYDPYFETYEDIKQMHDSVMKFANTKRKKQTEPAFKKATARVKKFCYQNDDYCVIAPSSPLDFNTEGIMLHHCVGFYLERVISGSTNIMFIRKKTAPDKPFFTVEISNNGNIEQIHGFSNRNLDTEPDLITFVKEWQKERNVKLHNINKIR